MKVSKLTEYSHKVLEAVGEASDKVMEIYNSNELSVENKLDGSPVTIADKLSHEILSSALKSFNDIPIISEEGVSIDSDLDLFWLIDPLDGTKEFINRNGEFTVNVALVKEGIPVLGVVSAPAIDETFVGFSDQAYKIKNGQKTDIFSKNQDKESCSITLSKSHKSDDDEAFIDLCKNEFDDVNELPVGSSLKLCRVSEGEANIYIRLGPTYQWDIAAGQAIVEASGGCVSNLDGEPLRYESISKKKNPLFYCSGDVSYPWLSLLRHLV